MPRHFFSWRSLWDLYQALRVSIDVLCPPDAPAPAVLVLPLIGLVYRRETGPCVFVSDDSARKVRGWMDRWMDGWMDGMRLGGCWRTGDGMQVVERLARDCL
jgi:hypothetical protein